MGKTQFSLNFEVNNYRTADHAMVDFRLSFICLKVISDREKKENNNNYFTKQVHSAFDKSSRS